MLKGLRAKVTPTSGLTKNLVGFDKTRNQELIKAAKIGDFERTKNLIDAGADVNVTSKYGETALHWAVENGHTAIVNLLLVNGAKVDVKYDGVTALHIAVHYGHREIVEALVNAGADVNVTNKYGETALHWAAEDGNTEIVNLLLANGAKIHANCDGVTALHWATDNGNTEIVKLLLNFGADVNARNNKDATALHIAVYYDHREIVEALVKAGAKINVTTDFGMTVLELAKHYHHELSFKNAIEKVKTDVFNELKLLANTSEVIEEAYSVKNKIFTFLQLKNYLIEEYNIQDNEAVTQDQINVMYTLYQFPKMIESFEKCLISLKEWYELENPVICKGKHFEKEELEKWKQSDFSHPITYDKDKKDKIVYFEDIAMKKMIELHKKISITKIQAMARGNQVRKEIKL